MANTTHSAYDPFMPLYQGAIYHHQKAERAWHQIEASALKFRLETNPPEFRTILGILSEITEDYPPEGWNYLGPLYCDFDAENIAEAIEFFLEMLEKLEDLGVDLKSIRLFASGGKGFHIEVPMPIFLSEIPPEGIRNLPYIYKEMAAKLQVPTLDMRVYTAKRGREWRTPNVLRSNGHYKVPLTTAEALAMTPESYAALTSASRAFPALVEPTLCDELAELFHTASDKVNVQATVKIARRKTTSANDLELRRRFGGGLPPSVAALCDGRIPGQGGFNRIALQVCLTAHAVGMDEARLLKACEGLIQHHVSDGKRYNTPAKRRSELRSMYRYAGDGNYEFSVGGIYSILPRGIRINDFRGLK